MQIKKDIANMQEIIASANFTEEKAKTGKEKLKDKLLRLKMMLEKKKAR